MAVRKITYDSSILRTTRYMRSRGDMAGVYNLPQAYVDAFARGEKGLELYVIDNQGPQMFFLGSLFDLESGWLTISTYRKPINIGLINIFDLFEQFLRVRPTPESFGESLVRFKLGEISFHDLIYDSVGYGNIGLMNVLTSGKSFSQTDINILTHHLNQAISGRQIHPNLWQTISDSLTRSPDDSDFNDPDEFIEFIYDFYNYLSHGSSRDVLRNEDTHHTGAESRHWVLSSALGTVLKYSDIAKTRAEANNVYDVLASYKSRKYKMDKILYERDRPAYSSLLSSYNIPDNVSRLLSSSSPRAQDVGDRYFIESSESRHLASPPPYPNPNRALNSYIYSIADLVKELPR